MMATVTEVGLVLPVAVYRPYCVDDPMTALFQACVAFKASASRRAAVKQTQTVRLDSHVSPGRASNCPIQTVLSTLIVAFSKNVNLVSVCPPKVALRIAIVRWVSVVRMVSVSRKKDVTMILTASLASRVTATSVLPSLNVLSLMIVQLDSPVLISNVNLSLNAGAMPIVPLV